jgi:hypothetical protein
MNEVRKRKREREREGLGPKASGFSDALAIGFWVYRGEGLWLCSIRL